MKKKLIHICAIFLITGFCLSSTQTAKAKIQIQEAPEEQQITNNEQEQILELNIEQQINKEIIITDNTFPIPQEIIEQINENSKYVKNTENVFTKNFIKEKNEDDVVLTLFGSYSENIEEIELTNQQKLYDEISKIDMNLDKLSWFKEFKNIYNKYAEYEDVTLPKTIYDVFTEDELTLMFRCVETEVYTADFDSKVNVASVIFNRLNHKRFPNNITDIITGPRQFAYYRTEIEESSILALEYAYMIGDTTGGCIGFRSDIAPKTWNGWTYKFTDKAGHNFYID